MQIRMLHTEVGWGYLETAPEAADAPVFISDSGTVWHPSDKPCGMGYLHKVDDLAYSEAEYQWIHDYIVRTHLSDFLRRDNNGRARAWMFGASWKTTQQLEEIERKNNEKMVRNK